MSTSNKPGGALRYASERHTVELSYASSDTERAFFSAGLLSYKTEGETNTSSAGAWRLTDNTRLTYGFDQEEQSLSDASTDWSRDNTGIYLEAQQRFGRGVMTVGWRHDDNDDFGSSKVGVSVGATIWTAWPRAGHSRAAIGTGFARRVFMRSHTTMVPLPIHLRAARRSGGRIRGLGSRSLGYAG